MPRIYAGNLNSGIGFFNPKSEIRNRESNG